MPAHTCDGLLRELLGEICVTRVEAERADQTGPFCLAERGQISGRHEKKTLERPIRFSTSQTPGDERSGPRSLHPTLCELVSRLGLPQHVDDLVPDELFFRKQLVAQRDDEVPIVVEQPVHISFRLP